MATQPKNKGDRLLFEAYCRNKERNVAYPHSYSGEEMTWSPMTEEEIWSVLNSALESMSLPQRRLWDSIRIIPEKWQQHPYGDKGGGFWAVAIIGRVVVWYNDIEEGFNRSKYTTYGEIDEYYCDQDELEWTIQHILNEIYEANPSCR